MKKVFLITNNVAKAKGLPLNSQLIVTTHSDALVDTLTDQPESVVICEKHEGSTEMRRLDKADLSKWLDDYRLGDLWTSGELGGNRW